MTTPTQAGSEPRDDASFGADASRAVIVTEVAAKHKILIIKAIRVVSGLDLMTSKAIADRPTPFILLVASDAYAEAFVRMATSDGVSFDAFQIVDARDVADPDGLVRPALTGPLREPVMNRGGCASVTALLLAGAGVLLLVI